MNDCSIDSYHLLLIAMNAPVACQKDAQEKNCFETLMIGDYIIR